MSNRTVEVKVSPCEGTQYHAKYSWRKSESSQWKVTIRTIKSAYRVLLNDIYRDGIPISNINIDHQLVQGFEQYQNSHRSQIEFLRSSEKAIWSSENVVWSPSLSPNYDSDIDGELLTSTPNERN